MLSTFPDDCTRKIISFLPLHSALKYASTSTTSMNNTIVDLKKRRKKLSQTLAWVDFPSQDETRNKNKLYNLESVPKEAHVDCTYRIPSALERLKCLRRSLTVLHPLRDSVHELIVEVENNEDDNDTQQLSYFESLFQTLQKLMKGHKLHGRILKRVLYNDSMMDIYEQHGKVPLYLYVGDMLIVYFCMSHSVSNIIEGISETKWTTTLLQKLERFEVSRDDRTLVTNDWYHLYIFFHSTILRTLPMGLQMIKLGIVTEAMVNTMSWGKNYDNSSLILIPQPKSFSGDSKEHLVMKIEEHQKQCCLKCTVFDFGPLGPAFRGRDNVSHIFFNPVTLAAEGVSAFWHMDGKDYIDEGVPNPYLQMLRENSFEPVLTLMRAFQESKKVHPMNVEPPHVAFDLYP
jgi:hypothetical protein